MAFSDETVQQAWARSGGYCECRQHTHDHGYSRCRMPITFAKRGKECSGAWEAHHKSAVGGDGLFNCEILCWECHKAGL